MFVPIADGGWERRSLGEVRVDLSEDRKIRGYAIVFNTRSVDLGGFTEVIRPTAVDRTINKNVDVRALWNHDMGEVLGRRSAGTLMMRKDHRGLAVEIDPPSWAKNRLETIERGDVTGMSFKFCVPKGGDDWREEDGLVIREVSDMTFVEVSVVSFPAYEATDAQVALRSLQEFSVERAVRRGYLERFHKTRLAL
jgi:HK97 family phage prohead protease